MEYSLEDTIRFGMHKGTLIKELIENNLKYVERALDEVDHFELDDKAMELYDDMCDEHYGSIGVKWSE